MMDFGIKCYMCGYFILINIKCVCVIEFFWIFVGGSEMDYDYWVFGNMGVIKIDILGGLMK